MTETMSIRIHFTKKSHKYQNIKGWGSVWCGSGAEGFFEFQIPILHRVKLKIKSPSSTSSVFLLLVKGHTVIGVLIRPSHWRSVYLINKEYSSLVRVFKLTSTSVTILFLIQFNLASNYLIFEELGLTSALLYRTDTDCWACIVGIRNVILEEEGINNAV
jgi:hypothetical protein